MLARNGLRLCQQRRYSDLLRSLPKVGVSKFGRKSNNQTSKPHIQPAAGASKSASDILNKANQNNGGLRGVSKFGHKNTSTGSKDSAPGQKPGKKSNHSSVSGQRSNTVTNSNSNAANSSNQAKTSAQNNARNHASNASNQAKTSAQNNASNASNARTSGQNNARNFAKKPSSKPKRKRYREPIKVNIPQFVTIANLANILGVPLQKLVRKLLELGYEDTRHNYILDKENAALIADEFGFEASVVEEVGEDIVPAPVDEAQLEARAPIVAIMGHVDHGKTTILDYLRKLNIVKQEHGGITQHIGAFSVITPLSKKKITFLDTPGHAAFLKMRERGAHITDIIILVVAADDSVMPQTLEALKHARSSGVPIIVAINKCDRASAKPEKVIADLATNGVEVEDYGGDTQTVQISAKNGTNMDLLEEAVVTLSELTELQAEVKIPGEGWVIELLIQKGLGNVATVLVKRGTLKTGDIIISGTSVCKIRGMKDENGKMVKQVGPLTPVSIWGWKDLPEAGDQVLLAKTEQIAKKVSEDRAAREQQKMAVGEIEAINTKRKEEVDLLARQEKVAELNKAGLHEAADALEEEQNGGSNIKTLNVIVKSDVFGLAEAIKESIDGLGNDEVTCKVILEEAGAPTELDLDRAQAANAKVLCFNIKVPKDIKQKADKLKVDISEYNVIYNLIENVTKSLTDLLPPIIEQKVIAEATVKDVFTITGKNKTKFKIAGCKISSGNILRSSMIRVNRGIEVVFTGKLSSLKHLKDDVQEVKNGMECGLAFVGWDDFQPGDVVNVYEEVKVQRYL